VFEKSALCYKDILKYSAFKFVHLKCFTFGELMVYFGELMTNQEQINILENSIKDHRKLYWSLGEPKITDSEYDKQIEELRTLDPENILLTSIEYDEDSDEDNSDKIYHYNAMLSLEKKYSYEDVLKWMQSVARSELEEFLLQPKYDGWASRYYREDEILATRGNGEFGENITNKIPLITNVNFKDYATVITNGELLIKLSDFEKCTLVKSNNTKYKTPRNILSGVINLKDVTPVLGKINLSFVEYGFIELKTSLKDFTKDLFNKTFYQYSKLLDYPTDGMVIKLEDTDYGESLGATSHHYKSGIAYKAEDEEVKTTINDVIFQHGKQKLVPVGIISPVDINGVTVNRATLHNAKNLLDKDIHIGDTAYIIRSNDVIPYITRTEPGKNRTPIVINQCPVCDSKLDYIEPDLFCTNKDCEGNLIRRLSAACKSLEIAELGEPTIEKMVYELNIESLGDILNLTIMDILEIDGYAIKSANTLLENISKCKRGTEDYKVLAALNISGISDGLFKKIMAKVNITQLQTLTPGELMLFDDLGYERSMNIYNGLIENKELIEQLQSLINIIETKGVNNNSKPKICFSGTFPLPKKHYKQLAENKGYEVVDSVSKALSILVTAGPITDKYKKAQHLNIKCINIVEFNNL
jgi:DNA ligase (NAD+)